MESQNRHRLQKQLHYVCLIIIALFFTACSESEPNLANNPQTATDTAVDCEDPIHNGTALVIAGAAEDDAAGAVILDMPTPTNESDCNKIPSRNNSSGGAGGGRGGNTLASLTDCFQLSSGMARVMTAEVLCAGGEFIPAPGVPIPSFVDNRILDWLDTSGWEAEGEWTEENEKELKAAKEKLNGKKGEPGLKSQLNKKQREYRQLERKLNSGKATEQEQQRYIDLDTEINDLKDEVHHYELKVESLEESKEQAKRRQQNKPDCPAGGCPPLTHPDLQTVDVPEDCVDEILNKFGPKPSVTDPPADAPPQQDSYLSCLPEITLPTICDEDLVSRPSPDGPASQCEEQPLPVFSFPTYNDLVTDPPNPMTLSEFGNDILEIMRNTLEQIDTNVETPPQP